MMMDGHDLEIVRTETGQVITPRLTATATVYVLSRPAKATRKQWPQPYAFTAIPSVRTADSPSPIKDTSKEAEEAADVSKYQALKDPLIRILYEAGMKRRNFKSSGTEHRNLYNRFLSTWRGRSARMAGRKGK